MFEFDLEQVFPGLILGDQTGYALAKAIAAGLHDFLDAVGEGLKVTQDIAEMPEWRLDEMAWELGCLYDYNADIEQKRAWIENAVPLYSIRGTPRSIVEYLAGYFGGAAVEENWQYSGSPFHFRVTVAGELNPENDAWMQQAVAIAKNVRSVLDSFSVGAETAIVISAETYNVNVPYRMCGTFNAGTGEG